jgi:hypothetical protein
MERFVSNRRRTRLALHRAGPFEFAPAAASTLLKSMTVRSKDNYTVDRLTLERVQDAITLAEKALGGGEQILA